MASGQSSMGCLTSPSKSRQKKGITILAYIQKLQGSAEAGPCLVMSFSFTISWESGTAAAAITSLLSLAV
jgi:hypothetical protein